MAGQINTLTCDSWRGRLSWPRARCAALPNLPGIAGRGTATDAAQAEASQIVTRHRVTSYALAEQLADAGTVLIGTTVRVVEPVGTVWPIVAVIDCDPQIDAEVGTTFIVTLTWTMLPDAGA